MEQQKLMKKETYPHIKFDRPPKHQHSGIAISKCDAVDLRKAKDGTDRCEQPQ